MPIKETSRVGRTETFFPPNCASFFIESLPDIKGIPYAIQLSCNPLQLLTNCANLYLPSGV